MQNLLKMSTPISPLVLLVYYFPLMNCGVWMSVRGKVSKEVGYFLEKKGYEIFYIHYCYLLRVQSLSSSLYNELFLQVVNVKFVSNGLVTLFMIIQFCVLICTCYVMKYSISIMLDSLLTCSHFVLEIDYFKIRMLRTITNM